MAGWNFMEVLVTFLRLVKTCSESGLGSVGGLGGGCTGVLGANIPTGYSISVFNLQYLWLNNITYLCINGGRT